MRKRLLLFVLLALMLSVFSIGYASTVQVGSIDSYTNEFPVKSNNGGDEYSYTQQIYTQTQINSPGLIDKIRFYFRNYGTYSYMKDWTIYMGHTQKTSFNSDTDWESMTNLTQVFMGEVLPSSNNYWLEITLDTPFHYNNVDNLLIAVHEYTPGDNDAWWGAFNSGSNTGIAYEGYSNPNPNNPPTAIYRSGLINCVQLNIANYSEAPMAPLLVSPENGAYVANGQSLSWTLPQGSADAAGYDVYIDSMLVSNNQHNNNYTLTNIGFGEHSWYVVARNIIGDSAPSETRTFNLVEIAYAPYGVQAVENDAATQVAVTWEAPDPNAIDITEGFEDETFPPADWTQTITNTTDTGALGVGPTWTRTGTVALSPPVPPTEGDWQAGLWWGYDYQDEWLITPQFACPPNAALTFDSYVYYGSTYDDHYYVKVSTDNGATWTVLWDASALTGGWNKYDVPITVPLTDYAGQQVKLAWHAKGTLGGGLWYVWFVDNIHIGNSDRTIRFNSSEFTTKSTSKYSNRSIAANNMSISLPNSRAKMENPDLVEARLNVPETKNDRVMLGYKVWRLLQGQEQNETAWTSLTPSNITATNYTDTDWQHLPTGVYKYAVKASYTNNVYSRPAFSNVVCKDLILAGTGIYRTVYPFNVYSGYGRSLGLYTADQIGQFGAINTMGWSVATARPVTVPYKIYVKLTTDTELTQMTWADFASTATLVKAGTHIFDRKGWHSFSLDVPIYYTHGNLLIGVETNYGGSGTGDWNYPIFHCTSSTTNSHQYWSSNNNPPTGNGSCDSRLPNLLMELSPFSDDPAIFLTPSDWNFGRLQINNSDMKTFTITNVGNGTLNLTGISPTSDDFFTVTDAPAFPVVLEFGESATFNVQYNPTAAGDHTTTFTIEAGGATTSLTVSGIALGEFALFESFEDTQFPPLGWSAGSWSRNTSYARHGGASAYKSGSTSTQYVLCTPMLTIFDDSRLNFWSLSTSYIGTLQLVYSRDRENWTQLGDDITFVVGNTWYNYDLDLSSLAGNNYYIGLRTGLAYCSYYVDMVVGPDIAAIALDPPKWNFSRMLINNSDLKTFTITNLRNQTLNLTGIIPMSSNFFEVIGIPPFPLSLGFGQSISFMIQYAPTAAGNHTTTFTIAAENTTADLVVSGNCYDPVIYEYPFFDGFEDWQTDGTQVQEWTQRLDGGKTQYWMANSSQSDYNRHPRNGSFNAILYCDGDAWLMRPFFLEAERWYEVEVWARQDRQNSSYARVGLYYGTSATIDAMTNTIKSQTYTGRRRYQPIRGVFSPANNGIYWLGIHGVVGSSPYYMSIDDFSVRQLPADHMISFGQDKAEFGTILAGSTTDYQDVCVTNISTNSLVLTSANVSIVGVNANMFEYDPSSLPLTINSSQSHNIQVRYNPSAADEHSAILRITLDGIHHDLPLCGKALPVGSLYESFEADQFPPPGWYGNWGQSTDYALHGTKSAYINGIGKLSTPLLAIEANDTLSFWVYRTSSSGALQLVYSQDGITWTQLGADLSIPGSYTWLEYTIDLSSLSGGNYYLGLSSSSTRTRLYMDMLMEPRVIPLATDSVTIGEGDASSSYFPIFGNYNYSYTQQIYTQDQIAKSGEISKIRFRYVSGNINPNKDWTIYMGNTQKVSFDSNTDWEPLSSLTQVFSGDVTSMLPEPNNWMEIILQTPFFYNNTDNLIIAIHERTSGGASMSWGAFTSGANTGICYYSNSTNPNPNSPPAATFRLNSINRIQLDFPTPAAPMAPLLVSPDNGSQIVKGQSLSWELPEGSAYASGYDLYIDGNLVSENHPNNYYKLTNLALGMHNWYVIAHNEIGNSAPSEIRTFILAQEVIIGTGTDYQRYPFSTYHGYTRSLGIYTADQIGQQGVINTVGWSVAAASNTSIPYKIYVKFTNETELSSMTWSQFTSGASLVKEGTHIFDSTGWHTVALDTPFNYTGGNLLIGVEANYGGSGTGTPQFHYTTSGVNTHQYWYRNNYEPTGSGYRNSNLPNLLLIFSAIADDNAINSYPWTEDFDSIAAGQMPEDWTIIASHTGADNRGWKADSNMGASSEPHAVVVYAHDEYAKDEWMISAPFLMQAGQAYHISFKVKGENEALALHWGIAPNVATLTSNATLYDNSQINYADWTEVKVMFVPDATGVYYFGWHAYTPVGGDYIAVDDISITLAPKVELAATGLSIPEFGYVGTPLDLNVTVYNMGGNAQTYCDIYIKEQGTDTVLAHEQIMDLINPNQSKTYTVNWTPTTFGNIYIYAEVQIDGDADSSNNTTPAEQVLIYPEGIYLGDTASAFVSDSCPFNLSYEDFVAETVYLASEIQATGGVIHALAYYNNFPSAQSIPAQVWMKNTTAMNLSDGWLPWNGYQLVFDGIIECPAGFNEVLIPITHFNYTGGNLAIRTSKTWENKWVANHNWLLTRDRVHPNRTRVFQTDVQNLDHTNPPTGNLIDYLPNVTFFMEIVDIVSAPVVAISTLESELVLNWEPVPGAGGYKVYASEDPYNFGPDPIATVDTNSFTMPTTATRRFFKVTSVGGRALGGRGAVMGKLAPRDFIVIDTEIEAKRNGIEKAKSGFIKRP